MAAFVAFERLLWEQLQRWFDFDQQPGTGTERREQRSPHHAWRGRMQEPCHAAGNGPIWDRLLVLELTNITYEMTALILAPDE